MLDIEINNKYDEIFINDNFSFKNIKDNVVTIIHEELVVKKALSLGSNGNIVFDTVNTLLNNGPEILKINILGLDITVALLEDLLDWDLMNPAWEVMFKINKPSTTLNHIGKIYNTKVDGLESFSYDILLERIADLIKVRTKSE